MLGERDGRRRARASGGTPDRDFDILQSWRKAAPKVNPFQFADDETHAKKRKTTSLKKQILAQRNGPKPNPLWTKFADQLQRVKDEKGSAPVEASATKDDMDEQSGSYVPYGLA